MNKKDAEHEKDYTASKKHKRHPAMVVPAVSMIQGIHPNCQRQHDHAGFESHVMNNIDTEKR